MLPLILIPIAVTGVMAVVNNATKQAEGDAIESGKALTRNVIHQKVRAFVIGNCIVMMTNLLLIITFSFVFYCLNMSWAKVAICSIYAASVFYGLFSTLRVIFKNFSVIWACLKIFLGSFFTITLGFYPLYLFIKDLIYKSVKKEVTEEVNRGIDNLSWYEWISHKMFGESVETISENIARTAFESVWKAIWIKILCLIIFAVLYFFVGRCFIIGKVIEVTTDLSKVDAFLYPFIYSVGYFI